MTVGIAGAGFCLVVAMVVLVVALGNGSNVRPPSGAADTSTSPTRFSAPGSGPGRYRTTIVYEPRPEAGDGSANAVHYALGLLVARFHGAGSVRGDRFRITRPGYWGISWQFRCTQGHPGNLTVTAGHATTSNGNGNGYGHRLGNGHGKAPPGQAKKHKKKVPPGQAKKQKAKKHKKKVPPGQAKKHKKKTPPGQAKKHKKKTPPGQAKKHKKKVPPGQAKKAAKTRRHGAQHGHRHKNGHAYQGDHGHQDSRVTFSATGYRGRGMSWYTSDPGDHTLDVVSGCDWDIKIVLPKP